MVDYLVTVVVPVYKTEKTLDRCVESILAQSYRNIEVLLIDDGSPDGAGALCDAWEKKDGRVRTIHKANAGLGMARNTGIENAAGDYICFFDSDDTVDSQLIKDCISEINKSSEPPDIVVFGLKVINEEEKVTRIIRAAETRHYSAEKIRSDFIPYMVTPSQTDLSGTGLWISGWSVLLSVNTIREHAWRFVSEREIISEDTYSMLSFYGCIKSAVVLSGAYYNYFMNSASLTHAYRPDRVEKIKDFYLRSIDLCKQLDFSQETQDRVTYPTFSYLIAALKQIVFHCGYKSSIAQLDRIAADPVIRPWCRFIIRSKCKAAWRIIAYLLHFRFTAALYLLLKAKGKMK